MDQESIESRLVQAQAQITHLQGELVRLEGRLVDTQANAVKTQEEVVRLATELISLQRSQTENAVKDSIFARAARVNGLAGDFLEFGAYQGSSLIHAYRSIHAIYTELISGDWDHSYGDPGERKRGFERAWESMRFIAFDSFCGLPGPEGRDAAGNLFARGAYACTEERFTSNVIQAGVPEKKLKVVRGYFHETLNDATAAALKLKTAAIVHIDCDLAKSASHVLEFLTPYLGHGSVIIFDGWYHFWGHPDLGEQHAFGQWRRNHPELRITEYRFAGPFGKAFIVNPALEVLERQLADDVTSDRT